MAVINTNIMSLTTQNNLNKSQSSLGTAIERLSSGLRINSAKDDAAGQAIANRMTAQVRGMTQAARNANDGISLTQTAEGNLNEINNNLQRIRELATQAANDPNGKTDRDSIVKEMTQRINEVNRVAQSASFNGTKLLDGSASAGIIIQVGANTGTTETITIDSSALINATTAGTMSAVNSAITTLGSVAKGSSANSAAQALITALDTALSDVDAARSNLGAIQNRFESTITNLNNSINNLSSARSRIEDADYATEVSNMSRAQILQQAGTSVLSQANQVPQTVLSLLR
ncbi:MULTISPECIES: flagellin N-terminal helical domain-containing protein [Pectobacterium]|uniref:flagellin N-terminal helical domain-containing protein n=1 Tax=Pectobacterium TaxID=122277 RepID=UPI0004E71131|nr:MULTISPECIES: flagellin [Pectobacterium]AVT58255.1 flagellin [Pectobacterium versatile]KFF72879.1 flagellin [Pectobacterium brasiliense]MCG5047537.1 flagellin FliC [Pectobacterium brasiliense]MCL6340469.1 flagellin FliC [Pectobacterium carotovorum subsp. carotovorum]MCL6344769.1 flagellin FliC [Pectobacterium carotovorum subsp. carotovorum]